MNPRAVRVSPKPNYTLEVEFSNHEVRFFDMKPHLNFGIFQELRDIGYFNQVRVEHGTVSWPHEQDICPDTLYEDSKPKQSDVA